MSGHVQSCTSEAMPSSHKYGYGGGVFGFFYPVFEHKDTGRWGGTFLFGESEREGGDPLVYSLPVFALGKVL